MGCTRAVYVARHACGFAAWNTNVTGYNYTIANTAYPNIDPVELFVASAKKYGMGYGFYATVVSNAYLNVCNGKVQPGNVPPGARNISQAEYDQIVLEQLAELWGRFGPLTEVWYVCYRVGRVGCC